MVKQPLSIYIPCVYCNITKQYILETFRNLGLGEVSRIDFVQREINNIDNSVSHPFNQAFVYFAYWNKNPVVDKLHEEIFDPDLDAKLVYEEPYYWRMLPNYNPRFEEEQSHNDLRTVIMALQEKVEHQNNLLTIMGQRIFDLAYVVNAPRNNCKETPSPERPRSQSFSNNKLPQLSVQTTVFNNDNDEVTSDGSYDILDGNNSTDTVISTVI